MKKILFYLLLLICFAVNGQKLSFDYDQAGNQTKRWWCTICHDKTSNQTPKDVAVLEDADFQKFLPEDEFSYYPNPVKEELYLKWPLKEDKKVKNISVYNLNGQLIKQYNHLETQQFQNIPFSNFPVATYILVLEYTNGEQKSINILKK